MGVGLLLNLVVLVAIVFAIVYGARWLFDQGRAKENRTSDDAIEILRSRYAKGEIERDEFEAKKRDLMSR